MFCWFCGKQNDDTSKFCYNCGKQLMQENPEEKQTTAPIVEDVNITEVEKDNTQDIVPENPTPKFVYQAPPFVPTLSDKEATASLVLSIIGVLLFWGVPIHILALLLGIRGQKSTRRKVQASVGIGLSIFSLAIFVIPAILIITNYGLIIDSEFFRAIYNSLY